MDKDDALARDAYAAYGEVTDHKNYQGLSMPAFDDLSETIRQAWRAAARAACASGKPANWRLLFDERQRKEIEFAQVYGKDFGHGTTGHNQLLIIARLAELLDSLANHE